MKLSGVIITYNEARNIGRCLTSLQSVCDEILVLDSFSNDATQDICNSFGVRFEQHPFEGHIQQKNEALKRATHPWILSLDADEALTPELQQAILALKALSPTKGAFRFKRLTNYCGTWIRHSGWYPDVKLRMASKEDVLWGGMNPHDQLIPKEGLSIEQLDGDLLHYSYYTKEDHFRQIGEVERADVAVGRDGRKKGFGFIKFGFIILGIKFIKHLIIKYLIIMYILLLVVYLW